jgi:ArsR family transcriptional regulator, arsenate/arsenite/antimonite-responsive transcriptional repressor
MDKLFRALGDKTRLEILMLVYLQPNTCLCDMMCCFKLSNSNLSRHLRELELANLVEGHKISKWKYYKLSQIGETLAKIIMKYDTGNVLKHVKNKINLINKVTT